VSYPKVSVVISTYNRPEMLDRALESVCNQTFSDFEVVVVDDCSPRQDETRDVMEKWYATLEGRGVELIAMRLGENSGYQCMPKNRGVEMARGDYIAYLDDDNTWRPDHLSKCVEAIEADFSTDLVYSRLCYHADEEAQKLYKEQAGYELPLGDCEGQPWMPALLTQRNYVDTSTILHSKGAFWRLVRDSGYGWDEGLRRFGDWNFVWRWAVHGLTGKLVDAVTVDYNWHAGSMQISRPAVEVPVCFNFAAYQALRKERNHELRAAS
jgi:glycosyltransferase involved in cell wall biosynthesis